jgi:polyisoprenyl-teichoic acid--peptidoglycan teichoic acid transferase
MAMADRQKRTALQNLQPPTWAIAGLAVGFVVANLILALAVYLVVRDLTGAYTGVGLNPFRPRPAEDTPAPGTPQPTPTQVTLDERPEPWDGYQRVTILLMGLDYRDWVGGSGAPRTDSMMVVTIDPITRTAGMLSVPRDLFVEIPGYPFDHNRINTAYPLGENNRLPGGGPALASATVEALLGVPVPYYAVIDFSVFERLVDEIGGVDVLVTQRVKISPIGRQSKWLEEKAYHLDGPDALAYARARRTRYGDIDRAARQQQVALAIRDRIVGFDMLPTLIRRAPALYQELASGVRTNLTLEQIVRLGMLALEIDPQDIRKGVIGPPDMIGYVTLPDGRQILRPIPDGIRRLRDEIFTETSAFGP